MERGLTFHIRERRPDGTLQGLLVHDEREPTRIVTYLAEVGQIVRNEDNAYLVMESGSLHQKGEREEEMSIVNFDRYVFDLSSLTGRTGRVNYHPREMRISELLNPDPDNSYFQRTPGRFRSELHERLSSILYPLAFVFVALAALGDPRTNCQGRGNSLLLAIAVVAGLRTIGFAATNLSTSQAWAVIPMYTTSLTGIVGGAWLAFSQERYMSRLTEALPTPAQLLKRFTPSGGLARLQSAFGSRRR